MINFVKVRQDTNITTTNKDTALESKDNTIEHPEIKVHTKTDNSIDNPTE